MSFSALNRNHLLDRKAQILVLKFTPDLLDQWDGLCDVSVRKKGRFFPTSRPLVLEPKKTEILQRRILTDIERVQNESRAYLTIQIPGTGGALFRFKREGDVFSRRGTWYLTSDST